MAVFPGGESANYEGIFIYIKGNEFVAPLQEFHIQEEEIGEEQSETDVYNTQGERQKNLRRGGTKFFRGGHRKLHNYVNMEAQRIL